MGRPGGNHGGRRKSKESTGIFQKRREMIDG